MLNNAWNGRYVAHPAQRKWRGLQIVSSVFPLPLVVRFTYVIVGLHDLQVNPGVANG